MSIVKAQQHRRPFDLSLPLLWAELLAVFVALPTVLIFLRHYINRAIIPAMIILSIACIIYLVRDKGFDNSMLWAASRFKTVWKAIVMRLVVGSLLLGVLFWLSEPERFLAFPKGAPGMYIIVLVLYPVLSAFPQEVIFRSFFFRRYERIIPDRRVMAVASALAFAYAHAFLFNWIAPSLAFVGGLIFSYTYMRSRSLFAVTVEHALWGDVLFTIGIGWYFYGGSVNL
ncbi:MAG: type II CAAX endopeptidase family protein [Planctomycetota bacterium]|nr:type II CAAX endopeptidase family protein [Planctomycetota bacterium]